MSAAVRRIVKGSSIIMRRNNKRPRLKQEWNLRTLDFQQHPVWRSVHGVDQLESWYESNECDEATFRPWDSEYPAYPSEERLLLVASTFLLRNGDEYSGHIRIGRLISPTKSSKEGVLEFNGLRIGNSQPKLFVNDLTISFWGGVIPIGLASREALYSSVGLPPNRTFPIVFVTNQGLTNVLYRGRLTGFYHLKSSQGRGLGKQMTTI